MFVQKNSVVTSAQVLFKHYPVTYLQLGFEVHKLGSTLPSSHLENLIDMHSFAFVIGLVVQKQTFVALSLPLQSASTFIFWHCGVYV